MAQKSSLEASQVKHIPGIAGSCRGCRSRWGSVKAGRSCNRRFPAAGQTGRQYEPGQQQTGWRTMPSDSLENTYTRTKAKV